MLTENELQARKLPELKDLGVSLDIPKARYMNKGELVGAILSKTGQSSSAGKSPQSPTQLDRKVQTEGQEEIGRASCRERV